MIRLLIVKKFCHDPSDSEQAKQFHEFSLIKLGAAKKPQIIRFSRLRIAWKNSPQIAQIITNLIKQKSSARDDFCFIIIERKAKIEFVLICVICGKKNYLVNNNSLYLVSVQLSSSTNNSNLSQ